MNEIKKNENLQLNSITLYRENLCLFKDFSLNFEKNKITVILAPSGAGKTTLLDFIAGLLEAKSGNMSNISFVSYMFQDHRLLPWLNLQKNVLIPLLGIMSKSEAKKRALDFLKKVGLNSKVLDFPDKCSGGEKQRCALARAFAFPSNILLMDEAFRSQDLQVRLSLMDLTETLLEEENRTVIFVTHDVREAICIADRIVVLKGRPLQIKLDIHNIKKDNNMFLRYTNPCLENLEIDKMILTELCKK